MKMTRHNGRSGKHGTYNPKHNDRRFDIGNSDHIDQERAKQNVYWDCYQGFRFPTDQSDEDQITYSFEQIERAYYHEHYGEYCDGQHERNRQSGHSGRDRSPDDLWKDKKTRPEESVIQIGTMEQSVPPDVLAEIAAEFFEEFQKRFGDHIHILDWSLHLDESTPHIHDRKARGEHVNERDLKKHKYDVFRLLQIARRDNKIETNGIVRENIIRFMEEIRMENIPFIQLLLPFEMQEALAYLGEIYR